MVCRDTRIRWVLAEGFWIRALDSRAGDVLDDGLRG